MGNATPRAGFVATGATGVSPGKSSVASRCMGGFGCFPVTFAGGGSRSARRVVSRPSSVCGVASALITAGSGLTATSSGADFSGTPVLAANAIVLSKSVGVTARSFADRALRPVVSPAASCTSSSAARMSSASTKRCAGCFRSARITTASSPGGRTCPHTRLNGAGSCWTCAIIVSTGLGPDSGSSPDRHW